MAGKEYINLQHKGFDVKLPMKVTFEGSNGETVEFIFQNKEGWKRFLLGFKLSDLF
jgi:hypothetical protein